MNTRVPVLDARLWFPDPQTATKDGLVALGGDLSTERLLLAYSRGIFPWTVAPVTWWSPDPRGIFEFDQFHVSRSLGRVLRQARFRVTLDTAFSKVIEGCARPMPGRRTTWISPQFIEAYTGLHQSGHAHSVECWQADQLVGGVYGVSLGGLFAGESMFHRVDNASKVALYHLFNHLKQRGFGMFDIQMVSSATSQLGAKSIPRNEYLRRLAVAIQTHCTF